MSPDAVRAAFASRAAVIYRWHERGLDCHARAHVVQVGGGQRVRVVVTRTDGSSFSRWVTAGELHPD